MKENQTFLMSIYLFAGFFDPLTLTAGVKMTITEAGDDQFVLISSRSVIPGGQQ